MKISELEYTYPEHLVGLFPKERPRVLWSVPGEGPRELTWSALLNSFSANDLIVLNNTRVLSCRVFSVDDVDVTFLKARSPHQWEVLTPLKKWPSSGALQLPGGVSLQIFERGRPQIVEADAELTDEYFFKWGEMALPPYVLKARGETHMRPEDRERYQTTFAERLGSLAAPTASLHLKTEDLDHFKTRGIEVSTLTLHVGLGTFLPVGTADLRDHVMHSEWVEIGPDLARSVERCRQRKGRVWAIGTTVARALESWALKGSPAHGMEGLTDLMIAPGFDFRVVDGLWTNFHQPKSTLLALVMAFAGQERVVESYRWAIEREFSLFSYGDLSVWVPSQGVQ